MSYFSQSKSERDSKAAKNNAGEIRLNEPSGKDAVSVLGHGMLITGNIVCTGAVQTHGRVIGVAAPSSEQVKGEELASAIAPRMAPVSEIAS